MVKDSVKAALQRIPYGFYAITTKHGEEVNIMVANWITQVSFSPRMIALGLAKKAYSYGLVEKGRVFAVNLFDKGDAEIIKQFTKSRAKNPDKVKNAAFSEAPETGCPVVKGAAAYVECKVVGITDFGGDHVIVVGEVAGGDVFKEGGVEDTLTLPHLGWDYAG